MISTKPQSRRIPTLWSSVTTVLVLFIGTTITTTLHQFCTVSAAEETLPAKPLQQPEQWQNDLVNWLISKPNGYFSDKILWTKTEMGYNMHAAEDIPKDTTLMIIPQAALITSDGTDEECVTIAKMMKEYEKGADSEYYPYIRYLFGGHEGGTSTGLLPTTWSQPAKNLLKEMIGTDLYPKKFEKSQNRILIDCQNFIDRKDLVDMSKDTAERWKDAFIFWVSRSWSDKMVPILDMINHRNGNWLNVESTTAHAGEDIRVYALRDIKRGEQLWSTCACVISTMMIKAFLDLKLCCCRLGLTNEPVSFSKILSQIRTTNAWMRIATMVVSSTATSPNTF